MEIRDAVDADWAAVWGFLQQIVGAGDTYCWPPDTSEEAARTWWMRKPGGRVLVAVDDGAVVGTAELHPNQPAAGSHVANAGFSVVDRSRQGFRACPCPSRSRSRGGGWVRGYAVQRCR